jgi:hypothetical protein
VEFLIQNQVELAYFNVLTPLPGTALYERYNSAGRIFDRDWAKYDGKHVVFHPSRMTVEQLQEGFCWANHQFYSLPSIWRRLAGTKQRLLPRLEMNRGFRKLVKRACPKGALSPVAKVLKNLQVQLPAVETEHLIPNALQALRQKLDQTAVPAHAWLKMTARRHDQVAALWVDLEGTLDRLNAQEVLKRISEAAERARLDIIVNFEHLKDATPDALRALLDGEALKAVMPYANVRYLKFKAAFETALQELSTNGLDRLSEDVHDA